MEYIAGVHYPLDERDKINKWAQSHKEYDVNEGATYIEIVKRTDEQVKTTTIRDLKAELAEIKKDIEQETFGIVRNDYAAKKARAAQIINELRVLEGKEPRKVSV